MSRSAAWGRPRPTVVVIGAGFAGLAAVKALRRARVRVVLIDRNNYHLFAPLLYQVTTSLLDPSEIAHPVRGIIRRVRNAEFRMADVQGIDLAHRKVITDRGAVRYDHLIVAAGSVTNFFGNDSVAQRSTGMKDLHDALTLRNDVLSRFEEAKWTEDGAHRRGLLNFVVVGGGPTGIETAGALAELVHHVLKRDYRSLDTDEVSITLLEASENLLGPFSPRLRDDAKARLEGLGVQVLLRAAVDRVGKDEIVLTNGQTLPVGLLIWAAGVAGSPLGAVLPVELSRQGRVPVEPTLQLPGHPEVFVVGDLAAIDDGRGRHLPMVAPVANQSGAQAAANVLALIDGRAPAPLHYRDKGSMATIGRGAAVVQSGPLRMTGFPAWIAWLVLHLVYITSFRSQLSIVVNWIVNFLHRDRPARLVLPSVEPRADTVAVPPRPAEVADLAEQTSVAPHRRRPPVTSRSRGRRAVTTTPTRRSA